MDGIPCRSAPIAHTDVHHVVILGDLLETVLKLLYNITLLPVPSATDLL